MQIEVTVFATLRKYLPDLPVGGSRHLEIEPGATLADLIQILGLPAEEVKIAIRNHVQTELDEIVEDGDRIAFAPAIAGG
ncbi:MAG: MoaD/ThiS family protein [Anaerolineales bacterium]|nr:MoaD/ThiS family protein [Anaerolineales bacterium]